MYYTVAGESSWPVDYLLGAVEEELFLVKDKNIPPLHSCSAKTTDSEIAHCWHAGTSRLGEMSQLMFNRGTSCTHNMIMQGRLRVGQFGGAVRHPQTL